jgi:hypothetical protein
MTVTALAKHLNDLGLAYARDSRPRLRDKLAPQSPSGGPSGPSLVSPLIHLTAPVERTDSKRSRASYCGPRSFMFKPRLKIV